MARTAIPVQTIPAFGAEIDELTWTNGDSGNGHEFENDGKTFLLMNNGSVGAKTGTVKGVASPQTFNRTGDTVVTPGAAKVGIAGPFPQQAFNQSNGKVNLDIADATSVTFAAVRFTPTPV